MLNVCTETKQLMVQLQQSCSAGKDINRSTETLGRYMCRVMITSMLFSLLFIQLVLYSLRRERSLRIFPFALLFSFLLLISVSRERRNNVFSSCSAKELYFIHHVRRFLVSPSLAFLRHILNLLQVVQPSIQFKDWDGQLFKLCKIKLSKKNWSRLRSGDKAVLMVSDVSILNLMSHFSNISYRLKYH